MVQQQKRTKIIATLGPACQSIDALVPLLKAGVDLVRINASHGALKAQKNLIAVTRQAASKVAKEVGILVDLQGPKIRLGRFKNGFVELQQGQSFILDCQMTSLGDNSRVSVDYQTLYREVEPGCYLLLNDGLIELQVEHIKDKQIYCRVINSGKLSDNKGINRKGGGLSARTLTDKDLQDLDYAIQAKVDYIAVSFTKDAVDITQTKQRIADNGGNAGVIAKIERAEALTQLDEIIKASDAVMVARGDLGVEIGLANVPFEQKRIIEQARALDKAVITATQMMESMISLPQPTRAEISDVANAVLEGTDAIMLSAETAVGQYPLKVIQTVTEVCLAAEQNPLSHRSSHRINSTFNLPDEAIAMAVMYTANHYAIRAIISLTESGATPLWMSRIRSSIPIYALSRHQHTLRKVTLYQRVYPVAFDPTQPAQSTDELHQKAIEKLKSLGLIESGDTIIMTHGSQLGQAHGTDSMKLIVI